MTTLTARLVAWLEARREAAATSTLLATMSDHELHDLGLTRSDVRYVASGWSPRNVDRLPG